MIDALHIWLWLVGSLVTFGLCGATGIGRARATIFAATWPAVVPLAFVLLAIIRAQSRWDLYRAMRSAGR
jgi:hypothetical protein